VRHLTVRVPWHDSRWTETICSLPSRNAYCVDLDRIRADRNDAAEDSLRGRSLADLNDGRHPPCVAEAGQFMAGRKWTRTLKHPYAGISAAAATHGHLAPTRVEVPVRSTFAVPYWWMLRSNQDQIAQRLADPLPPDVEPTPFPTAWVFAPDRQRVLLEHVFGQVQENTSLAIFYTKSGHPLDEKHSRLVIGVGTITALSPQIDYAAHASGAAQPMWDRLFSHSITVDGADGVLLPYHDYLAPTGDPSTETRRRTLVEEIAVDVEANHLRAFSYGSELAGPDIALTVLVRLLEAVRKIREHGIAAGPWEAREEWLNARIAEQWRVRGAYPGLGAALEGMGLRLGSSLVRELHADGTLRPDADPWPVITALLEGRRQAPRQAYSADLAAAGRIWSAMPAVRRQFIDLLSRLDISTAAATRWLGYDRDSFTRTPVSDVQLLANPYRLAELDLGAGGEGEWRDAPITVGTVDRGMHGDTVAPTPPPITPPVADSLDPRRVRAALVSVLRASAQEGDTLLAEADAAVRVADLDLAHDLVIPPYLLDGTPDLDVELHRSSTPDRDGVAVPTIQLADRRHAAERISKMLLARAGKTVPSLGENWRERLLDAIGCDNVDLNDPRHVAALDEQAEALETITTRRCAVLVGSAGTGKTTVLGALLASPRLRAEGVLLLAPTGKARVRLEDKAHDDAYTVAQFLYQRGRYDRASQRAILTDTPIARERGKYTGKRTVVIDEASMLTEDDLFGVLLSLNLGYVQRVIFVGDPNQLPPIGPGRPFADFVALLDRAVDAAECTPERAADGAQYRLTVQLRAAGGSAALSLAAWFTDDTKPVAADRILAAIDGQPQFDPTSADVTTSAWASDEAHAAGAARTASPDTGEETTELTESEVEAHARGQRLAPLLPGTTRRYGDLELIFWNTPEELRVALLDALGRHLGATDVAGFDTALHLDGGVVPFADHSGAEQFQILSPERMSPHGVHEINRLIQLTFRGKELTDGRRARRVLGAEEIVLRDKVICVANGYRTAFDHQTRKKRSDFVANGEVGLVASVRPYDGDVQWAIAFANRNHTRVYYTPADVPTSGGGDLELAYALTVHKAQGSEFNTVFVVVPKASRLLSRELAYTALTRARGQLVLLVEGDDPGVLLDLSDPSRSETGRRNTNLFSTVAVRRLGETRPFANHLRHEAADGTMVRSKSELTIYNRILERMGPGVGHYEQRIPGPNTGGWLLPDFTFTTDAGDTVLWEHLGMMSLPHYQADWEWKRSWYAANGFVEGDTLVTTREDKGLLTSEIDRVIDKIADALSA
jgi:hypothetical protein